ncbi:MAG: hypothetical protein KDA58_15815 [Planctomycetaceae bacterium]|nr:hypothetical protein [Planctomycetaceae bacterium]
MTCDEAFEVLTSPAASTSEALLDHLRQCARCRDLQEALAPAIHVLSSHAVGTTTPWTAESTARSAAQQLSLVPTQRRSLHWRRSIGWTSAIAFLLGAGAVAIFSAIWSPQASSAASVPTGSSRVCLWQTRDLAVLQPGYDSQDVITTCVACHLDRTATTSLP